MRQFLALMLTLGWAPLAAATDTYTPTETLTVTDTLTESPTYSVSQTFTESPTFSESPTISPSPTPTPTVTNLMGCLSLGVPSIGAGQSYYGGKILFVRADLPVAATLNEIRLHQPFGGPTVGRAALYSDNGSGTSPQSLLLESTQQSVDDGWNAILLPATPLAAGTYWLAVQNVNFMLSVDSGSVPVRYLDHAYGTFADASPATAALDPGTFIYSIYGQFCDQPSTATPTFSVSPTDTETPSITPTWSASPTFSDSPTETSSSTVTPTFTATPSSTATPTVTPLALGGRLYAVGASSALIRKVDPLSFAVQASISASLAGQTVTGFTGFARNPSGGQVWALVYASGSPNSQLVSVDLGTGTLTLIGDTGRRLAGLAADPGTGLYGVSGGTDATPSEAVWIDSSNATAAPFGTFGFASPCALSWAWHSSNSFLYLVRGCPLSDFVLMDPSIGATAPLSFANTGQAAAAALADAGGDALLLADSAGTVYSIHENGGSAYQGALALPASAMFLGPDVPFTTPTPSTTPTPTASPSITVSPTTSSTPTPTATPLALSGKLYGVADNSALIRKVNASTFAVEASISASLAGQTITGFTGLARDPVGSLVWALVDASGSSNSQLVSVDLATGTLTLIGDTGRKLASLAADNSGGLYGVAGAGDAAPSQAVWISPVNATVAPFGSFGFASPCGLGLAWRSTDSFLFLARGCPSSDLVKMDPANGATAALPFANAGQAEAYALTDAGAGALLLADFNGTLYSLFEDGTSIYQGALASRVKGMFLGPDVAFTTPTPSSTATPSVTLTHSETSTITPTFSISPTQSQTFTSTPTVTPLALVGKLYGVADNSALIRKINAATFALEASIGATLPGQTVTGFTGLARNPSGGQVWALVNASGSPNSQLVSVDLATGTLTLIGDTGRRLASLAADPGTGLYGVAGGTDASPSEAVWIDPGTAVAAPFGNFGFASPCGLGLAWRNTDGFLYLARGCPASDFVIMDPAIGATAPLSFANTGQAEAYALTDAGGGVLLLADFNGTLYSLHTDGSSAYQGALAARVKGMFLGPDVVFTTPTPSNTPSVTPTFSASPTFTSSDTPLPTSTNTETSTPSPTVTETSTITPTFSVTETSSASPTASQTPTITPTWSASPTQTPLTHLLSGLGRSVLGPVPARKGQDILLFFATAPLGGEVELYNASAERVARATMEGGGIKIATGSLAPGFYFARIKVSAASGEEERWQKIAVLP